jgi:hypothetical protein
MQNILVISIRIFIKPARYIFLSYINSTLYNIGSDRKGVVQKLNLILIFFCYDKEIRNIIFYYIINHRLFNNYY